MLPTLKSSSTMNDERMNSPNGMSETDENEMYNEAVMNPEDHEGSDSNSEGTNHSSISTVSEEDMLKWLAAVECEYDIGHNVKNTCKTCNKEFSSAKACSNHRKSHLKEKSYHCPFCSASFSLGSYLKAHTLVHTGQKPFKCDQCEKSYTQKSSLNIHYRTHTGVKPYECDVCQTKFAAKSYLTYHMRVHKTVPISCNHCPKKFEDQAQYSHHLKSHSRFRCKTCGKKFLKKTSLINHKTKICQD